MSSPHENTAADELWDGLTRTTFASFAAAVALCAAELVACCIVFQPRTLARINPQLLMVTVGDEYPELTIKLLKLRYGPPLTGLHVSYVGASQATRSLANADAVGEELTRAAGRDVTFHLLSSDAQWFEEALAITDQLPPTYRGVVVMGVDDYKDDYKPKALERKKANRRRIAVDSPSLAPFFAEEGYVPPSTGIYFLDHLDFFAARRITALRLSPADAWPQNHAPPERVREHWDDAMARLELRRRMIEEDDPRIQATINGRAPILTKSRPLMRKLLANMKRRKIGMILLQNPDNPIRREIYGERIARYEEEMAEFADAHGAVFWDFNPELHFTAEDFQDDVHLGGAAARRRFQDLFVERVAKYLRERFHGKRRARGDDDE